MVFKWDLGLLELINSSLRESCWTLTRWTWPFGTAEISSSCVPAVGLGVSRLQLFNLVYDQEHLRGNPVGPLEKEMGHDAKTMCFL